MPQPTASDVHVDRTLTNLSIAFLQNATNFVAMRVFPNVPVEYQSDRYFVYDRGDFNRDEAEVRAPGTETSGSGYELDNTPSYFCNVWGHHKDVPDQVRRNSDPAHDPDRAATAFVTHKLLIRREKQWATNYFTGGVWDNDYDGVASSAGANETLQWSDYTNGDPIGDIDEAKDTVLQNTGFLPNKLVLGREVFTQIKNHPDVIDRIKYSGGVGNLTPAMVTTTMLATLFDLDEVLVMNAIENTAAKGATDSHSFIGGKKALLTYASPAPALMEPSAGYTFSWTNYLETQNELGLAISTLRMPEKRADRIEGEIAMDQKLVSSALGFFWDSIVA